MDLDPHTTVFANPYRPGAGHMPPHLAGRQTQITEFLRLLEQETILENMVLTGLRGVGKTVLLETLKPLAINNGWLWVGADLSESTSVSEDRFAVRLLTDLSVVTSGIVVSDRERPGLGFAAPATSEKVLLDYQTLIAIYGQAPGLVADKIKTVLELVWACFPTDNHRGIVFAYDEAQNLADHSERDEYPMSMLLDVFQSIQRKGIPFMLVLTGLPTLFPKLVEARTYAERMFRVVVADKLDDESSREAIVLPMTSAPIHFDDISVGVIIGAAGGYPYFIQFVCREVFDVFIQQAANGEQIGAVPMDGIIRKLDTDFFAGRWARATDRQRALLSVVARLPARGDEFAVQEVVQHAKVILEKPFSASHVNQMLVSLCDAGLIYKNRYGRYAFAVPLLDQFILRQEVEGERAS